MENNNKINKRNFISWSTEAAIRITLIGLMLYSAYQIFKPFIVPVTWGIIIAVSLFPLAKRMHVLFGGRKKLTAVILSMVLIALLIVPVVIFTGSIIDSARKLSQDIEEGKYNIPLSENQEELSSLKQKIIERWQIMSKDMGSTVVKYAPQLKQVGQFIISSIKGLGGALVVFIVAIILAGVFIFYAEPGYNFSLKVFRKLTDDRAAEMLDLSIASIRNVMQGVIGIAVIQTVLVGVGFFIAGVPGAPILTMFVLVLGILQIPSAVLVIPVVIYYFSIASSGAAIGFGIYCILASLSDNVLKPMLLGRGMAIPMLVILIGAIGGMLVVGPIGLFIGPVILSLGYQLFLAWVGENETMDSPGKEKASLSE